MKHQGCTPGSLEIVLYKENREETNGRVQDSTEVIHHAIPYRARRVDESVINDFKQCQNSNPIEDTFCSTPSNRMKTRRTNEQNTNEVNEKGHNVSNSLFHWTREDEINLATVVLRATKSGIDGVTNGAELLTIDGHPRFWKTVCGQLNVSNEKRFMDVQIAHKFKEMAERLCDEPEPSSTPFLDLRNVIMQEILATETANRDIPTKHLKGNKNLMNKIRIASVILQTINSGMTDVNHVRELLGDPTPSSYTFWNIIEREMKVKHGQFFKATQIINVFNQLRQTYVANSKQHFYSSDRKQEKLSKILNQLFAASPGNQCVRKPSDPRPQPVGDTRNKNLEVIERSPKARKSKQFSSYVLCLPASNSQYAWTGCKKKIPKTGKAFCSSPTYGNKAEAIPEIGTTVKGFEVSNTSYPDLFDYMDQELCVDQKQITFAPQESKANKPQKANFLSNHIAGDTLRATQSTYLSLPPFPKKKRSAKRRRECQENELYKKRSDSVKHANEPNQVSREFLERLCNELYGRYELLFLGIREIFEITVLKLRAAQADGTLTCSGLKELDLSDYNLLENIVENLNFNESERRKMKLCKELFKAMTEEI